MISPELLRRYSFFGGFSLQELKELAMAGSERILEPGEALFAEGDRAGKLYFLADGELETLVHGEGEDIPISTLPAGEPMGWSALIEPCVYTASARTTRQSKVLVFGRQDLARLLEEPHFAALLMRKLAEVVSRRLRDTQLQSREPHGASGLRMGKRKASPPRQPRPSKTGWDWRKPPRPKR